MWLKLVRRPAISTWKFALTATPSLPVNKNSSTPRAEWKNIARSTALKRPVKRRFGAECELLNFSGTKRAKGMQHPFRSEEHTSELQSLTNLVCRLLLEKK